MAQKLGCVPILVLQPDTGPAQLRCASAKQEKATLLLEGLLKIFKPVKGIWHSDNSFNLDFHLYSHVFVFVFFFPVRLFSLQLE